MHSQDRLTFIFPLDSGNIAEANEVVLQVWQPHKVQLIMHAHTLP